MNNLNCLLDNVLLALFAYHIKQVFTDKCCWNSCWPCCHFVLENIFHSDGTSKTKKSFLELKKNERIPSHASIDAYKFIKPTNKMNDWVLLRKTVHSPLHRKSDGERKETVVETSWMAYGENNRSCVVDNRLPTYSHKISYWWARWAQSDRILKFAPLKYSEWTEIE